MNDSNTIRPVHGGRSGETPSRIYPPTDASCGATPAAADECARPDDGRIGPHALRLASQAWCEISTERKTMDTDLAFAFARILERELRKPWLGNATTGQLLDELRARSDLGYRTVGR